MQKLQMDLSNARNAEISKNQTALTGVTIIDVVLALAYLIEVVKGVRSIGSYLLVLALCLVPCVVSYIIFAKKKDAVSIRYILGGCFAFLYGYIMFTTSTELTFCYIVVAFVILMVYVDMKFLLILGTYAFLINVARIILMATKGELSGTAITNAEIVVVCLLLTFTFVTMALGKISKINRANIEKAAQGRDQSESLLATTLDVATSMTDNITEAMGETSILKESIDATQRDMASLAEEVNQAAQAIDTQKQSTEKINSYIRNVGSSVTSITEEVAKAQENLDSNNQVMQELLEQVKISETSNEMVAQRMASLKECADKMQDIMGLIASVAKQTGMLALNASIEAARAGEAGRGFAVVATEISSLSAQTNNATGEINTLIEDIVNSVGDVTEAMEKLLESSRLQGDYIENTAANIKQIHSSTQSIEEQVTQLKETVDIVLEENKQVEEGIENIASVTRKVTDGADETLANCNSNLQSIAKVADIMNALTEEAAKLQTE